MTGPAPVRLVFLGGLGEIGRNCAVLEVENRLVLIDCGLMFPEADMPGIDLVLPDFTYLRENADRIDGVVLTHGHEDHVGALSYLLRETNLTVFGSRLTLGLARSRVEEAGLLDRVTWVPVSDGETVHIGPIPTEFIAVTHSVPHGFATAFHTPQGVIVHSGDFKLDATPVDGRRTDLARIGALAHNPGIRLLLADSTNAEEEGFTPSEREVGRVLKGIFRDHPTQRIVVACFASHIHRVQQVADAAIACGRKVATLGRSMGKNVALAREMGLLTIPEDSLLDIADARDVPDEELCVVSTGSQGEPMSALALMAAGQNKFVRIGSNDVVILSSHAIPGNEYSVNKVIDGLFRRGADVIHAKIADVHVSGHARRGELRTLLNVAKPEFFLPVHGEFRHLIHHARLAYEMGIAESNVVIAQDGDVVELGANGPTLVGQVPADHLYVDGTVGDVRHGVLRDRRVLAEEGVVMCVLTLDTRTGGIVTGPQIVTRGWVHADEAADLLDEAAERVFDAVKSAVAATQGPIELDPIRRVVRRSLGSFVSERTKRRPMIVPVILET